MKIIYDAETNALDLIFREGLVAEISLVTNWLAKGGRHATQ